MDTSGPSLIGLAAPRGPCRVPKVTMQKHRYFWDTALERAAAGDVAPTCRTSAEAARSRRGARVFGGREPMGDSACTEADTQQAGDDGYALRRSSVAANVPADLLTGVHGS